MQNPAESIEPKIILYRYRICVINLAISLPLISIIWAFQLTNNFVMMLTYSIWLLFVYISLLISELRYKGLNILLLYVVGTITHLAYPAFEMSKEALEGVRFSFLRDYTDYIFPTAIAMNLWYMIFIISTTYFSNNRVLAFDISTLLKRKNILITIVIIYFIGILVRFIPELIFFSDTIKLLIGYFPQLTLLLLSIYCAYNEDKKAITSMIIIVIIEVSYAIFFGFTKHAIVFNMLFVLLYFFLRQRNKGKRILTPKFVSVVVLFLMFVIFFVFPFMNTKRIVSSWDPLTNKTISNYSNWDILMDVFTGEAMKSYRLTNQDKSATEGLVDRANFIPFNAYFYMSGDKEGHNPILLKGTLTYLFPRILRGGNEHDVELNYHLLARAYLNTGKWDIYMMPSNSGIPTGAFGGAYLWGGWLAVILVSFINAFIFTKVLIYCMSYQKNLFSLVLIMMMLMSSLSCFEETHDGGVANSIKYLGFAFIVYITNRLFGIQKVKHLIQ